jgi:peptidoglycan/xylan/chitin deacetylase (PgdA/CDA1 family)
MLAVSPDSFREQMQYLKGNFPIVRFEENWAEARKPAIAITFDDGYADNALEALPILEELGVPATFFVSTGTIGTTLEFWWHELERIILAARDLPSSFTLDDGVIQKRWLTTADSERQELYHEIVHLMNDAEPRRRDAWLSQIRSWAAMKPAIADTHRAMTVAELQLLAASSLVTIGAHTVSHTRLSSLASPAQREEIVESKRQLESWLGREITVFSYPFGRRCDYTGETVTLCREAGFAKAAANFPGQTHRWTDPFQIPRQLVRDWPVDIFTKKLKRFWRS